MIPKLILVGQFDSPVTRRVGVVLHHYGIPFTRDTRSIFGDAAEIAKINPMIRIPALILDDGEVLIDSNAILDHLDEQVGPTRALIPPSGPIRRKILQATARASACFEKSGVLVYERIFHPPEHVSQQWETRCQTQLAAGLTELENRFEGPWLCGDILTHADIMLTCAIGYMNLRLGSAFPPGAYPNLEALAAKCEALPAFIACRIGANETMPKV
jgi:glutathione S-transferase